MARRKGPIGSARATRRSSKSKVDDESESQQLRVSFADLPSGVAVDILLRLPIKSIVICKCVCTSWKALISEPHFAKLHFQHSSTGLVIRARDRKLLKSRIMYLLECEPGNFENDDDGDGQFCCCEDSCIKPECNRHFKLEHKLKPPLRGAKLNLDKRHETKESGGQRTYISCKPEDDRFAVVNSCNGLLCLCDLDINYFIVCNPVTGEFIRLPETTRNDKTDCIWYQKLYVGFGFQPETNEYKVVRVFKRWYTKSEPRFIMGVEIHTLGSSSTWKNVEVDPGHVSGLKFPTCVSGAIYWFGYYDRSLSIVCFEFESESFQSFPAPSHSFTDSTITMGEYGGSLYICTSSSTDTIKMWILKKCSFGESWTEVFSIDIMSHPYSGLYYSPVKHLTNGATMLLYHSCNCFIYYEPEKYRFKVFKVRGTRSKFEAIPHIPSLISLKDVVKGDNIKVMNVHSRCGKLKLQEENKVLFLAKVNEVKICPVFSDDEEKVEEYTSEQVIAL